MVLHKATTSQSGQREVLRKPTAQKNTPNSAALSFNLICYPQHELQRTGSWDWENHFFTFLLQPEGVGPLPSHNTTCREEKGKIQEQWSSHRNMSEGRIAAWHWVTVMETAKDNRLFPCLSQMMIPSRNFFFSFQLSTPTFSYHLVS